MDATSSTFTSLTQDLNSSTLRRSFSYLSKFFRSVKSPREAVLKYCSRVSANIQQATDIVILTAKQGEPNHMIITDMTGDQVLRCSRCNSMNKDIEEEDLLERSGEIEELRWASTRSVGEQNELIYTESILPGATSPMASCSVGELSRRSSGGLATRCYQEHEKCVLCEVRRLR